MFEVVMETNKIRCEMNAQKKRVKDPRDYHHLGGKTRKRRRWRVTERSSRVKTWARGIQCYRKSVRVPGKEPLVWAGRRLVVNIVSTFFIMVLTSKPDFKGGKKLLGLM